MSNDQINVKPAGWKLVEVGRVVIIRQGEYTGRLAAVAEIIDQGRVLIDGPSEDSTKFVPRQQIALNKVQLTSLVLEKLPKAAGSGVIKKSWAKNEIDSKYASTNSAKRAASLQRRRELTDFERFKVLRLKKQARFQIQKSFAKIRASAKA